MFKSFVVGCVGVALGFAQVGRADTIAYSTADLNGNQNWTGNLGLDFNVVNAIAITAVGAYDSGGDGISPPIQVGIFARLGTGNPDTDTAGALVPGTTAIISGSGDPLINGYRFVSLASPVYLLPGFYSIEAVGFGPPNPNGNENISNFTITTDSGGGSVQFVGTGRYDTNLVLDYPTSSSADQGFPGLTPHPFAGASFQFVPVPLPSSVFGGLAMFGLLAVGRFRSRVRGV